MLRLIDELEIQAALRLARFDALGGPAGDDTHSLAGWLGHCGRMIPSEARRLAVTAKRLHLLDQAMEAFTEKRAGFGDVCTIAGYQDPADHRPGRRRPAQPQARARSPRRDPDAPPWKNAAGHRRLQGLVKACEAALASAGENGIRERGGAPVSLHIITTDPEAGRAGAAGTADDHTSDGQPLNWGRLRRHATALWVPNP